mmetsp:Transcript_24743/g.55882  ORF Transcript_24743/g.55882 Transcript_24743/m.55882 type:complete len:229 (+) Transcript_24743:534-1220(+)
MASTTCPSRTIGCWHAASLALEGAGAAAEVEALAATSAPLRASMPRPSFPPLPQRPREVGQLLGPYSPASRPSARRVRSTARNASNGGLEAVSPMYAQWMQSWRSSCQMEYGIVTGGSPSWALLHGGRVARAAALSIAPVTCQESAVARWATILLESPVNRVATSPPVSRPCTNCRFFTPCARRMAVSASRSCCFSACSCCPCPGPFWRSCAGSWAGTTQRTPSCSMR